MGRQRVTLDRAVLESGLWLRTEDGASLSATLLLRLLEAIGDDASLTAAAKLCAVSYRHAWGTIDAASVLFGGPLLDTTIGGLGGGGSRLTALGEAVKAELAALVRRVDSALDNECARLSRSAARQGAARSSAAADTVEGEQFVLVAATYEVVETGVFEALATRFCAETGIRVGHISAGSGAALSIGKSGRVDAVLSHAPELEQRFLDEGWGVTALPLMRSRFVLIGPDDDPAGVRAAAEQGDPVDAVRRIALRGSPFVSRGDSSGTHLRELALWRAAGITPTGAWYRQSGAGGNARLLEIAGSLKAYALIDGATVRCRGIPTGLQLLYREDMPAPDDLLENRFSIISTSAHDPGNGPAIGTFMDWLDRRSRDLVTGAVRDRSGQPLFKPVP